MKTLIIYIFSGIGGNIFSILIAPGSIKVGASTSLYGLIGVIIGYVFINWNGLIVIGTVLRCQLICITIFLIFFVILFSSSNTQNVDFFGHLGGFLTGLWISAIHDPIQSTKR
jgi:membrane associated rhomboid family serine protease